MSTTVTIAVAAPNHRPMDVTVQELRKSGKKDVWVDSASPGIRRVKVGEAITEMMYAGKRLLIEEVPE